jgi:NADH-quinone oxidoreductase subunit G
VRKGSAFFRRVLAEPKLWVAGTPVALEAAIAAARDHLAASRRPAALVSSWASDEELAAFASAFGRRVDAFVKDDWRPQPGEVVEDRFLIRADKNPNNAGALARFPAWDGTFRPGTDLVIVWGEGVALGHAPATSRVIGLDGYASDAHRAADVFIPIAIQTEKRGHYTNGDGKAQAFAPCFDRLAWAADAEALFALLAAHADAPA